LCEEEEGCLSKDEIHAHWRLACCTRVYSPVRAFIPKSV
jgi:ferredoxin